MNYYEVLEIKMSATQEEVRTAYRKMAKKHHPDLNRGKSSTRMILINQAYETLNNPTKRKEYDRKEGLGNTTYYPHGRNYNSVHTDEATDPFVGFGGFNNMEDMFRNWYWTNTTGGGSGTKGSGGAGGNGYTDFKRHYLSVATIKRILKQDIQNKKSYIAYSRTQCDLCTIQISSGSSFWFIGEKQKMCVDCKDDILSHL